MTITLYLEHKGMIRTQATIPYAMKEQVAEWWRKMYAGKTVTIFYKAESKMNYESYRDNSEPMPATELTRPIMAAWNNRVDEKA